MAINPTPSSRTRLGVNRAFGLYALYVLVFVLGGGFGAGIPAFLFNAIVDSPVDTRDYITLYAVMFGVTGYIAYRLAQRVAEGADTRF